MQIYLVIGSQGKACPSCKVSPVIVLKVEQSRLAGSNESLSFMMKISGAKECCKSHVKTVKSKRCGGSYCKHLRELKTLSPATLGPLDR